MCLLFILIFQSISCKNIILSSCSPVQIYILFIMLKNFQLFQKMFHVKCCSTYVYNWVHFLIRAISWTIALPCSTYLFQHYPWCFYYFQIVFISYWVHLFDIIFYLMLYVCIFFTNQLQYVHTCTYTMMYSVCHLHCIYIWDIYLSMNFYWLIHFTICYYCHSQNNTTVHNWYMSWNQWI